MMRTAPAFVALVAALATAVPATASDHLVAPDTAQQRLREAAAARERDHALVAGALASPHAEAAAARAGVDLDRVRAAAATLSDDELRDLAARAAALQTDPVAALDHDIKTLLTIFLIVAIVILVLQAVD
ncbi:MAG TPA: hypothetical protein VIG50_00500 [Vicinamibacteria bacterium]|jgi:hypothetical protein